MTDLKKKSLESDDAGNYVRSRIDKIKAFFAFMWNVFHFTFWGAVTWPWKKLPGFLKWWWNGTIDWRYRLSTTLSIPVLAIFLALTFGPLVTGYPAYWAGTYAYNYYSVIYPKPVLLSPADSGKATLKAMKGILETMLVNWQPNDLAWSSSKSWLLGVNNPRNFQLGVRSTLVRTGEEWREHFSRELTAATQNPKIEEFVSQVNFNPEKFWFPSTESYYSKALEILDEEMIKIDQGRSKIYSTSYYLDRLLEKLSSNLSSAAQRLQTPWVTVDAAYYQAQGALWSTTQVLKAVQYDFTSILKVKGLDLALANLVKQIETNRMYLYDPLIVMNGQLSINHAQQLEAVLMVTSKELDKFRNQTTN